jgi:hypothetical protein
MTITAETVRNRITQMRADIAEDTAGFGQMPADVRQRYAEILEQADEIEQILDMPIAGRRPVRSCYRSSDDHLHLREQSPQFLWKRSRDRSLRTLHEGMRSRFRVSVTFGADRRCGQDFSTTSHAAGRDTWLASLHPLKERSLHKSRGASTRT